MPARTHRLPNNATLRDAYEFLAAGKLPCAFKQQGQDCEISHQLLSQWIAQEADLNTALDQLLHTEQLSCSKAELLQQHLPHALLWFIRDNQGVHLAASESYARLLNQPVSAVVGANCAALFPPLQADWFIRADQRALTSRAPLTEHVDIASHAGLQTFALTLTPLDDTNNPSVYGTLLALPDDGDKTTAENELETIFQSLPDLFFRLAKDGTILDYRAQATAELYVQPEIFLGKKMQDVLPPDLGQLFVEKAEQQRQTGELIHYEYDLTLASGVAHFEGRLRDLPGTDQQIALVRNITQQYQEHQARIHAEQQLAMALEAAQEGVWDWDIRTGLWTANARFFEMLGYPLQSTPQTIDYWNTKIHPEDAERRAQAYQAMLKGKSNSLNVEFRTCNAQGKYQWVRARGKIVAYDEQGQPCRAVGTHEEITERKALDERLKLAATVFESTAEGVIIANPKGYIIEVNQGFEEVTGFSRKEVLNRHLRILNSGRQAPGFYRTIWEALLIDGSWKGEIWNRRKDGQIIPEWLNINAVYDDNNNISHFVAVFSDISVLKRSEEKLDYMAHHDALTGLPNRLMLQARLGRALVHAHRNKSVLALLFLDVDRFKSINDSLGHSAGDEVLKQVAKRLKEAVRAEDTIARLGGDEFVVLLESLPDADAAAHIARKILSAISQPFKVMNKEFFTSTSIGISLFPNDGNSPSALMRNADSAMYQVKQEGRNGYRFYTEQLTTIARKKAEMETELHKAITNNELVLYYQPQLNLENETLIGVEALLRWQHPVKGMIAPDLFIPLAEESGLIQRIGEWVYHTACAQLRAWLDSGLNPPRMAVNVSGAELLQADLLGTIKRAMQSYNIPGARLEVEITENLMMQNLEKAINLINSLRDLGIAIAIDDFGTGYSSLAYLKKLPIHRLKIDRAFVRDLPDNVNDKAIAKAIIAMGESLGMEILAEGVETREQQNFLRTQGCTFGQGYLFARPLPADDLIAWFQNL